MAFKRVLIVGGGSAGWITAAYMDAVLNSQNARAVDITLVESPNIARIGVGEATVPSLRDTMRTIGVDEKTFMKATDATFKQAIKFVNWSRGEGEFYYHPFDRRPSGRLDRSALRWLTSKRNIEFAKTVSIQPWLCDDGRAPKVDQNRDYEAPLAYAYHMDAEQLADFLCELAVGRGVRHIKDDVVDVRTEGGAIRSVQTQSGETIEADLFIDCTGFRALLIGDALGGGYVDYSQWLLCDRAVAMRVPHELSGRSTRLPYTTATAMTSGWIWDIGLAGRRGVGYVYSSSHLSDDEAMAELKGYEGPHADAVEPRQLRFRVGRRETPWLSNCVSIGLSSGFIEPLESTGLFLVEIAAATLCEYFPFAGEMHGHAERFNKVIIDRYEEILDFIVLHYCLTQRDDTAFWREVQKEERIPERLREGLALWRSKSPSLSDFHNALQLFSHHTYEYVLYGMNYLSERQNPSAPSTQTPANITEALARARAALPEHDAWLRRHLGDAYASPGTKPSL